MAYHALDLYIRYRNPDEWFIVGIAFGKHINQFWKPLTQRFELTLINEIDTLAIDNLEQAECLFKELTSLLSQINSGKLAFAECPEDIQRLFYKRIEIILPYVEGAIKNWDEIEEICTIKTPP